jgi:hypothetical protein
MVIIVIPSVVLAQQTPAKPHVYYLKGDKLFGKTKHGGYNCRKQADAAGYRASKSR